MPFSNHPADMENAQSTKCGPRIENNNQATHLFHDLMRRARNLTQHAFTVLDAACNGLSVEHRNQLLPSVVVFLSAIYRSQLTLNRAAAIVMRAHTKIELRPYAEEIRASSVAVYAAFADCKQRIQNALITASE